MNYQTLIKKLKEYGYEFKEHNGLLEAATPAPALLAITHRYPRRKTHAIQTSQGYATRISLPEQPPEEAMFYWCTDFYTAANGARFPIGSDWSQLKHIVSCKRASTERSLSQ